MGISAGSAHSLARIFSSGSGGIPLTVGSSQEDNKLDVPTWLQAVECQVFSSVPQQVGLQDCKFWEAEFGKKLEQALCQENLLILLSTLNSEYFCSSPFLDLENRRVRESASGSFNIWPVLRRG